MDIKKLREEHPQLLAYLHEKGYHTTYIMRVKRMLNLLFLNEGHYDSYEDFYTKFVCSEGLGVGSKRNNNHRNSLRVIHAFDEYGRYPIRIKQGTPLGRTNAYLELIPNFKRVIDNFLTVSSTTCKRETTIVSEARTASVFFLSMQNLGASDLASINERMVYDFFFDAKKHRDGNVKSKIERVLKCSNNTVEWEECKRVMSLFPPIRTIRKNYPYMKKDEAICLLKTIDSSTSISLRDKAIIKLLYYTGLRGVDITKMKIDSIDWCADKIHIVQSKTGTPLVLPLRATVGNAIYDYIRFERPNGKDVETLFLNTRLPEKGLAPYSLGFIVSIALAKLGIRKGKGERQKGVRLFRHNLASMLLEKEIPTRIISDILGHSSLHSLNPYIDADIVHLRELCLDIDKYPVRKEVFDI